MRAVLATAAATLAVGVAMPVQASDDWLDALPCSAGEIAHSDIIAGLIDRAQLGGRGVVLVSFSDGALGDLVGSQMSSPGDDRRAFGRLYMTTSTLISQARDSGRLSGRISGSTDEAVTFLNRGGEGQLRFACATQRARGTDESYFVVTSTDDAGATPDLENRPFATVSYAWDADAGAETISTDVYVGLSTPVWVGLSPFVAYQRQTG